MTASRYRVHDEALAEATLAGMLARVPGTAAAALRWAWRASPRDTAATLLLHAAAGVFGAVALIAVTGVLEELFSAVPTAERVAAALPALLALAGAAVARGALQAAAGWAQARLKPQVERRAEVHLFDLTARIDLESFDDSSFNDAMYRARDRGLYEAGRVIDAAVEVLSAAIGLAAVAGVLAVLHPVLLPLLALTVAPAGWAAVRAARMRYRRMRELTNGRRRKWTLGDLLASRDSAAELRAYTMGRFLLEEYTRLADRERDTMLAVARRQTAVRAAGDAAGGAATAATYAALGALLLAGGVPLAVAGTAVLAIRQGQAALQTLLFSVNLMYESGLYFTDFTEFCAAARRRLPPAPPAGARTPGPLRELAVRGVHFSYPTAEEPSLRGVDLRVRAGEIVALVGENGSGKTTLARLVCGLYRAQRGTVAWNGADVAELPAEELRRRIGLVAQEYCRWPMTAERNVAMDTAADPDRLARAARQSGADEVVARLARGWDTVLDPRFAQGADLSGGQWQRIAGARGLYRDADLLIVDEPTAALDARAEHAFFETLREHARGRTVVLITHRLASVRMADRIVVLDRGRVAEQGAHAELIARGGLYAELYRLQADAYRERAA
ncbi:ABC transporter ATP-binding protein [Nocardiopsis potens]|uniref:ABC transporter ATP-binding protein n=1 Tax=Nocardiopsis potens TaxID=1246458 RepID=UPI000349C06F|nr:ATP-binding cassette domain-containing protein [Nocardiopsis potens]